MGTGGQRTDLFPAGLLHFRYGAQVAVRTPCVCDGGTAKTAGAAVRASSADLASLGAFFPKGKTQPAWPGNRLRRFDRGRCSDYPSLLRGTGTPHWMDYQAVLRYAFFLRLCDVEYCQLVLSAVGQLGAADAAHRAGASHCNGLLRSAAPFGAGDQLHPQKTAVSGSPAAHPEWTNQLALRGAFRISVCGGGGGLHVEPVRLCNDGTGLRNRYPVLSASFRCKASSRLSGAAAGGNLRAGRESSRTVSVPGTGPVPAGLCL